MANPFGCKAFAWAHVTLAALAARELRRPVKLGLIRAQMYSSVGYRPATIQRMRLAATRDGQLTAILHDTISQTSPTDDFIEAALPETTRSLYACPNVAVTYRLAKVNMTTPTVMRAPGEPSCLFALDSAMDELAYKLNIDPLELRLRNYAETDPETGLPWSSKSLRECYQQGAERFGWSRRNPKPLSMREGRYLIGWGMATATYPVYLSIWLTVRTALGILTVMDFMTTREASYDLRHLSDSKYTERQILHWAFAEHT